MTESEADRTARERSQMLRTIADTARMAASATGRAAFSPRVMEAMGRVPRHEFVPDAELRRAYADCALPIGSGQTISQPYIVALMTDLAEIGPASTVLEVGTGCGYQSAVLSELAGRVYSIELLPELAEQAAKRLARLGYANVEVRTGDGYEGWREHAPFDAILVTAGASEVPPPLIEQLAPGGRLVIPVGSSTFSQELLRVEKSETGEVAVRDLLPVAFVPLRRGGSESD